MEDQDIIDRTTENSEEKKRPTAITVICILGFIGASFTIIMASLPTSMEIGSWYPQYLGLSAVIGFVCILGLWQMKKGSAYAYAGLFVLNQIVLLTMRAWDVITIIPAIIIGIALYHVNKMD